MSESFDNKGLRLPPAGSRGGAYDSFTQDPITGPPTLPTGRRPDAGYEDFPEATGGPMRDLGAATQIDAEPDSGGTTPIVPAGSVTGRSLTLVIAIMCFFACLTAGAVYLLNQSASAWLRDVASEVTIQVEPRSGTNTDATVRGLVAFVEAQPGILSAEALPVETSRALLEPWLGQTDAIDALAIPRLIAVRVDPSNAPDLIALGTGLTTRFPGATLDDHRQWQSQIRTVTRSFALGGLAILFLVGAATTAIIVSATRSAMLSNREIVEVLHFVGATDRFIAREFERHFLALGIRAGCVGALLAALAFLAMPTVMQVLGGGSMTMAEIRRMVGSGSLDLVGYGLLVIVVVVIAALCMLTSRYGVYRILHSR